MGSTTGSGHNRSYFRKLVLYMYGVGSILLFVFGGLIASRSIRSLQSDYSRFSIQLLAATSEFSESRFRSALALAVGAFESGTVTSFIYRDEHSVADEQLAVREMGRQIAQNDAIDSVYLYNRTTDVYSRVGSVYPAAGSAETVFQDLLDSGFDGFWKIVVFEAYADEARTAPLDLVTVIVKEQAWDTPEVDRAIIINMRENKFLRSPIAPSWEGLGVTLIVDRKGTVVSSTEKSHVGRDYSTVPAIDAALSSPDQLGSFVSEPGGFVGASTHLVTFARNRLLGWTFVQVTDRNELVSRYYRIIGSTLILVVPFLAIGFILAYVGAGRLYRPIATIMTRLQRNMDSGDQALQRNMGEIDVISRSIDQMSAEIAELSGTIVHQTDAELNQVVRNALTHSLTDSDRELFRSEKSERFPRFPIVLVTLVHDYRGRRSDVSPSEKKEVVHLRSLNLIQAWRRDRDQLIVCVRNTLEVWILLSDSDARRTSSAREEAEDLLEFINSSLDISFSAAVSERVQGIDELSDAADVADDLLRFRRILGRGRLISTHDTELFSDSSFEYPTELEQRLLASIRSGKDGQFERIAREILDYLAHFDVDHFEYAVTQLTLNVVKEMNSILRLGRLSPFVGYDFVGRLESTSGIDEHHQLLSELYGLYHDRYASLEKSRSPRSESTVSRAQDVIADHLGDHNLDLTLIASELGISANHLSRVFKDETGTNLTAFIRHERMERARKLLVERSDLSIGEIAVLCGYPDINYFSHSFRTTTGVSPSTFRSSSRSV